MLKDKIKKKTYLSQPELTCQVHDLGHEIGITPYKQNQKKNYKIQFSTNSILKD
jgi:hypothetical protein